MNINTFRTNVPYCRFYSVGTIFFLNGYLCLLNQKKYPQVLKPIVDYIQINMYERVYICSFYAQKKKIDCRLYFLNLIPVCINFISFWVLLFQYIDFLLKFIGFLVAKFRDPCNVLCLLQDMQKSYNWFCIFLYLAIIIITIRFLHNYETTRLCEVPYTFISFVLPFPTGKFSY